MTRTGKRKGGDGGEVKKTAGSKKKGKGKRANDDDESEDGSLGDWNSDQEMRDK